MNSPGQFLGTKELLAQLDALKNTARDFAAREEKLETTFRSGVAKQNSIFAETEHSLTAAASVREGNETDGFAYAKEELQAWITRRTARITRAHNRVRDQLERRIAEREAECNRAAQQGLIAAEKTRDAALAEARTATENLLQRQAAAATEFLVLESEVRSAFGGCGKFRQMLTAPGNATVHPADNGNAMLDEAEQASVSIRAGLVRFKKNFVPQFFRFAPLWLWFLVLIGLAVAGAAARHFGHPFIPTPVEFGAIVALAVMLAVYILGTKSARPDAQSIANDFLRAKLLIDGAPDQSALWLQNEQTRIENEFAETKANVNQEWKRETREITQARNRRPVDFDERIAKLKARNEAFAAAQLQRRAQQHESQSAQLRLAAAQQKQVLVSSHQEKLARLEQEHQAGWLELETGWKRDALPLLEKIQFASAAAENTFSDWSTVHPQTWQPPQNFLNAARFGRLEIESQQFFNALPKDKRLALPCPAHVSLPLLLMQPQQGSLLIETSKQGDAEAMAAINNLILRLLASAPAGRVELTIFDPVGLGQNFATLMHLADYEAGAIDSRIWTQATQFEEKLADLNEHMEKIIQMYLRNEYATIAEYNAQAGSTAEKYHVLVVASFPVNFTDTAARRLRNIAASGGRCGVFTLVHWDHRNAPPADFVPDELRTNSVSIASTENGFEFSQWRAAGTKLILDTPPSAEFATDFLHRIGDLGRGSNRVEVPFESVAPGDAEMWQEQTASVLRVPIGRSGATKFQNLEIGQGTRQHALIAGKTGSGKSTLFHVIITNLAMRCSPEEVEFYLVDFKKGVEFKCYGSRRLPHARVVAIESDREFGLSVLQRVDDELRRRGDLFRKVGAQDLAGFRKTGSHESVPRTLLLIDEFQEFFTEEDRISQGAAVLLDRIVRQGRAFGIHVILGSQTLGGAYTLARATFGQMVIRIALQCNEADAYLIMDQDNPAPRLLSRPGEGIYNDAAGAIKGNAPFQAVWLSDKTRDNYLEKIRSRADQSGKNYPGPIVFEGNAPADIRENYLLQSLVKEPATQVPAQARIWLGAPNSIKGPTEALFQRQSGSNLLLVGQGEERTATILSVGLIALAAQFPKDAAKFFVLDATPPGFPQRELLERVAKSVPQPVVQGNNGNIAEVMTTLAEELKLRAENESSGPEILVLIQGLQNFKKLRQEDEFSFSSSNDAPSPAAIFANLITEGPARGIHLIAACDTFNNVGRFIGRKGLTEFELRAAFQMSASDSASLIDSPNASTLGLNRAVLFNEREGSLETFRPYALPDNGWLEEAARSLAAK